MKQIFSFAVSKILFVNLLCIQCHPVRYSAQKMPSDYHYTPFAYRNYSPLDTYDVPSTQTRMYYPAVPYHEEQRSAVNSTFLFSDFKNDLEYHHEKPRYSSGHGYSNFFPGLRDSSKDSSVTKHDIKYDHEDVESVATHPTVVSPVEDKGISVSFLKPDWDSITKPATSNMDKWSDLLQLILAFITGSKSGGLQLKGFQDIIINGILKPILATKGNIKSFVSKITIPLLSLVLINIEVLVTVWWLWEDCPKEMKIESMDKSPSNYTNE